MAAAGSMGGARAEADLGGFAVFSFSAVGFLLFTVVAVGGFGLAVTTGVSGGGGGSSGIVALLVLGFLGKRDCA